MIAKKTLDLKPFEIIELRDIPDRLANNDFTILCLNKVFPTQDIRTKVEHLLSIYTPRKKDLYEKYKGIGLQYENDEDPLYDVVDNIAYITRDTHKQVRKVGGRYNKKNELGKHFQEFFDFFKSELHLIRGRILISEPGNKIEEHTDGNCSAAIHFVVKTNPLATIVIDNVEYHIPEDGRFYLVNSARPHYIKNNSNDPRIHIVFMLTPGCFNKLTKKQIRMMEPYFDQFGIDPKNYKHLEIVD